MKEYFLGKFWAVGDGITGAHGVKDKFRELNKLNSKKSSLGGNATEIVQQLQQRLGKMYAIAHLIHYR